MEELLISYLYNFFQTFVSYIPNVLSSLILILVGIIIGKILSRVVEELLERSKVENYILGKKIIGLSSIFSLLVGWSIYLIFIKVGLDILRLEYISKIVENLTYFIGRLIMFLVAFLVGLGISNYIRRRFEESKIEFREFLSRIIYYVCIYIVLVMSLPILGVDTTLLFFLFLILVIVFTIPISLGFSLAIKDEFKPIIRSYFRKGRKINKRKK